MLVGREEGKYDYINQTNINYGYCLILGGGAMCMRGSLD